jgi:hypothetical protein
VQHRAAPGDRLVLLVEEELDRDRLDAGDGLEREDLALGRHRRAAVDAEHARDRVAPDVGVERGRALALELQRGREVRGDGRLADPALAGPDADHVLDGGKRALGQRPAAEPLLKRLLLVGREDVEADGDRLDPVEGADVLDDGLLEVGADRAAGGRQRHDDIDAAGRGLLDRAHHPKRDDVLAQLRIDDGSERLLDLITGRHVDPDSSRRPQKAPTAPKGAAG